MAKRAGPGAMDDRVGLSQQLRPDVDYERPPRGGAALFDLLGDLSGKRVLDFGCGLAPFREVIEAKGATWIGLELTGTACSVIGDGNQLPFRDGSFDGVLCAAVLEHMPEPDRMMAEVRRVLVDGGKVFGYVAFLEPLHGLSYFHMSHMGLEYLLLKNGFRPTHIFSPHIGTAYQLECMLFPAHVPVVRPVFRRLSQWSYAALLFFNRAARRVILRLRGRPDAGDSIKSKQYKQLQALRFGIGFNFVAERMASIPDTPSGYGSLVREG